MPRIGWICPRQVRPLVRQQPTQNHGISALMHPGLNFKLRIHHISGFNVLPIRLSIHRLHKRIPLKRIRRVFQRRGIVRQHHHRPIIFTIQSRNVRSSSFYPLST